MTSKTIIVTGSAGFIGGQTALLLKDAGYTVYGIDRIQPPKHLLGVVDNFLLQDFASDVALSWIINKQPNAIIHCAGTSLVGPSVEDPAEYYNNNVIKTSKLLDTVRKSLPRCRFVFSSSAATYGNPIMTPCQEIDPTEPISPYGESKLMIEWMLRSYNRAYGLDYVAFRYFNACGADSKGRHGQAPGATHIISRVLESIRDDREFTLYGDDYETPDNTCVRDYVHVEDIASAHIQAINTAITAGIYNLGTTHGVSNREIIDIAQRVTGRDLKIVVGSRRKGDPAILTADSAKFQKISGWAPHHTLDDVVQHAWAWYNR